MGTGVERKIVVVLGRAQRLYDEAARLYAKSNALLIRAGELRLGAERTEKSVNVTVATKKALRNARSEQQRAIREADRLAGKAKTLHNKADLISAPLKAEIVGGA
jgi:hypothetical protein